MDTTISVIIPHFGEVSPTLSLVRTLLSQVDGNGEIVVVDDDSPEPFPEYPGVVVVRRAKNGGFGSACNSGAAVASGRLLLFLNSDAAVEVSFVRDIVRDARAWQPCVAGPRIIEGATDNASARHFPTIRQQFAEWLIPLARFHDTRIMSELLGHDTVALRSEHSAVTDWLVGAALLVPRDEFNDIGGFDERFFMNCEEVDLQRRLRMRGLPAVYLPDVVIRHLGGGSSDPGKRRRWVAAARDAYEVKWGSPRRLRVSLTVATGINLAWNAARRIRKPEVRPLKTARLELHLIWDPGNSRLASRPAHRTAWNRDLP